MKPVVDAAWLEGELGSGDLFLGDVRGPNAHARGHLPGSKPLVLGSPPPMSDRATVEELAVEVGLRLRRHGVTGSERLVLYDRGDGVGAMPAAQLAELAGHPQVAVLLGGFAGWTGPVETGQVELDKVRVEWAPNLEALPTRDELLARLEDPGADGARRPPPRGVHAAAPARRATRARAGSRVRATSSSSGSTARTGCRSSRRQVRELVGLPEGAEIVAYCHSGSRSAAPPSRSAPAGYKARNYAGSWHEWSRHPELPAEKG